MKIRSHKMKGIVLSILLATILVTTSLLGCVAGDPWQENWYLENLFVQEADLEPQFATRVGSIWLTGDIRSQGFGMFTAVDQGIGLWIRDYDVIAPLHTGVGSFDLIGGLYENLFTSTTNIFEIEDMEERNWIIVLDETTGYAQAGEIETFIDAQNVVLDTLGWTADLTDVAFGIFTHPLLLTGAAGQVHIHAGTTGHFRVHSVAQAVDQIVLFEVVGGADGIQNLCLETNASGYSGIEALCIEYITGDLQPADHASLLKIALDETEATASDATTEIDFINLLTTGTSDLEKHGIHIGQSFTDAIRVSGGIKEDPDHGYQVTLANVPTDRVNGIAPDGTAFLIASASDELIFGADGDYILIGSDATFEAIDVILTNGANKPILAEYYYSLAGGLWADLTVSETTNDFTQSGTIAFTAPGAWALTNVVVPAGAAINNAYYIKIVRTRNNLGAVPVEDYFNTYTSSSLTDFTIRGDGTIRPVEMADASAPNNSLYFSTTQNKLVYKDNGGVVHDLW